MKMGRATTAGLCFLGMVGALLAGPAARAEVTLQTMVNKVETTLDDDGRVRRELLPADSVLPGEELRYSITFTNSGETLVDAERIVITNPIPEGTEYLPGTAGGDWSLVEYSVDGETFDATEPSGTASAAAAAEQAEAPAAGGGRVSSLRWTYRRDLPPGGSGQVFFHVRMQ